MAAGKLSDTSLKSRGSSRQRNEEYAVSFTEKFNFKNKSDLSLQDD